MLSHTITLFSRALDDQHLPLLFIRTRTNGVTISDLEREIFSLSAPLYQKFIATSFVKHFMIGQVPLCHENALFYTFVRRHDGIAVKLPESFRTKRIF